MKLSLSWIFDHIQGSWKDYDVKNIVAQFNKTTAEIEHVIPIKIDLHIMSMARVISAQEKGVLLFSLEWNKEFLLPMRSDAPVEAFFVIIRENRETCRWAKASDWGSQKEDLLPAFLCDDTVFAGGWKDQFESEDYIFLLENKSITHRPDLWGHRGIAREIAATLHLPLIDETHFLSDDVFQKAETFFSGTLDNPYTIQLNEKSFCKRFSIAYIPTAQVTASDINMAHRLVRIDSRPINAVVDATNYVMFEFGHPMHAFDCHALDQKSIMPRLAYNDESLTLLDGQRIHLCDEDIIIADGSKPLALAGVMGGDQSKVSLHTDSILLEAGCFESSLVRKSAMRYKKRTEASARFEKSLDPANTMKALRACLHILKRQNALMAKPVLATVGHDIPQQIIQIEYGFIAARLGFEPDKDQILDILTRLGFEIDEYDEEKKIYQIKVPSFRLTKDAFLPEDIVEEIGRFIGYDHIPLELPRLPMSYAQMDWVYKNHAMKHLIAYGMRAHEVMNYAFFDEEFLSFLHWHAQDAVAIKNPVSQHWRFLVTSLVPHLIKNVYSNQETAHILRFFEMNRIWKRQGNGVSEKKSIASIFFDREGIDFYACKDDLNKLFTSLAITATWTKPKDRLDSWYHPYQTACLMIGDKQLGYAGKVDKAFLSKICQGDAFIVELDGDLLEEHNAASNTYTGLPKFPPTWFDVSLFVDPALTVEALANIIKGADTRIFNVDLIDFFQKENFDKRGLTLRFFARDQQKTLTKDEIDHIYTHVKIALQNIGAVIR